MKRLALFAIAVAMALLTACAAVGSATPDTFDQKLGVSIAGISEVRETATTLLQAGKITPADAQNVQAQADVARQALTVARGMAGTDLGSASTRLDATNAALKALQAYLIARQGAKP